MVGDIAESQIFEVQERQRLGGADFLSVGEELEESSPDRMIKGAYQAWLEVFVCVEGGHLVVFGCTDRCRSFGRMYAARQTKAAE
jgi:hypothetical protein